LYHTESNRPLAPRSYESTKIKSSRYFAVGTMACRCSVSWRNVLFTVLWYYNTMLLLAFPSLCVAAITSFIRQNSRRRWLKINGTATLPKIVHSYPLDCSAFCCMFSFHSDYK
jgi:hypothetical protein